MLDRFIIFAVYAVGLFRLLPALVAIAISGAVAWVCLRFIFQVTSILLA